MEHLVSVGISRTIYVIILSANSLKLLRMFRSNQESKHQDYIDINNYK